VGSSVQRHRVIVEAFGPSAGRLSDHAVVRKLQVIPGAKSRTSGYIGVDPLIVALVPNLPFSFALIPLHAPHNVQLVCSIEQKCVVFQGSDMGRTDRVGPEIRVHLRAGIAPSGLIGPQNVGEPARRIYRLSQHHRSSVDRWIRIIEGLVGRDRNAFASGMTIRLCACTPVARGVVGVVHDDFASASERSCSIRRWRWWRSPILQNGSGCCFAAESTGMRRKYNDGDDGEEKKANTHMYEFSANLDVTAAVLDVPGRCIRHEPLPVGPSQQRSISPKFGIHVRTLGAGLKYTDLLCVCCNVTASQYSGMIRSF